MHPFLLEHTRSYIRALLLVEAILTSGCSLLNINRQINELTTHSEQVFRHQNQVIDQIMEENERMSQTNYQAISQAELNMYDQCQLLNDYVTRERDGLAQDFLMRQRILGTINNCEASINAVEKLLPH